MYSVLFFILLLGFLLFVGIVFLGLYLLSSLLGGFQNLRALFYKLTGWGPRPSSASTSEKSSRTSSQQSSSARETSDSGTSAEKKFGTNEGTYVDFEEV